MHRFMQQSLKLTLHVKREILQGNFWHAGSPADHPALLHRSRTGTSIDS
jgi:hypothetical protein